MLTKPTRGHEGASLQTARRPSPGRLCVVLSQWRDRPRGVAWMRQRSLMPEGSVRTCPAFLRRLAVAGAAVGLLSALMVGPATAAIGDQLFYNGGEDVTVDVQFASAGFTSELYLFPNYTDAVPDLSGAIDIATNCTIGPAECDALPSIPIDLSGTSLGAGDELVFGIHVLDTDDLFLMGPASRNADGVAHANVTALGPTTAQVGFEDLFGGGDADYDDNLFNFTAVIVNHPPTSDAGDAASGNEGSA